MKLKEIKLKYTHLSLLLIYLLISVTLILGRPSNFYFIESFDLVLVSVLISLFLRHLITEKKLIYNSFFLAIVLLIALTYFTISQFSISKFESMKSFFYAITFFSLIFIVHFLNITTKTIISLFKYLILLSLMVAIIGLYFYLFIEKDRLSSVFNNPNVLASFFLLVFPISYYLKQRYRANLFWNIQFAILAISFILTWSRGGLISFFLATVLFLFLFKENLFKKKSDNFFDYYRKKQGALFFIAVFVFMLFLLLFINHYENILNRFSFSYDLSLRGRVEFIQAGWRIFKDNIIKGTGPGTYKIMISSYQISPVGYSIYPHNVVIELLSEFGLIGIIFLIVIVIFSFKVARELRYYKYPAPFYFIFLGFVSFLLNMFFEVSWHYPGIFFILALYIGLLTHLFRKKAKDLSYTQLILVSVILIGTIFWFGQSAFKSYWYNYYLEWGKFYLDISQLQLAKDNIKKTFNFFNNEENNFFMALASYLIYSKTQRSEQLNLAKKFAEESLRYNLYQAKVYDLQGLLLVASREMAQAEKLFLKAISLDKFNNPNYYINLGLFYYSQNRVEEAIDILNKILLYYPSQIVEARRTSNDFIESLSRVHYILALIYKKEGNIDKQRYHLLQALKVNKYNVEASQELNNLNNQ